MNPAIDGRNERKQRLKQRLPLLLGAIPFALAGIDALLLGRTLFGLVSLGMAISNLIASRFIERAPVWTHLVLGLLNSGVAVFTAIDYLLQGKQGLPYAWAVVAVFYLVMGVVCARRVRVSSS